MYRINLFFKSPWSASIRAKAVESKVQQLADVLAQVNERLDKKSRQPLSIDDLLYITKSKTKGYLISVIMVPKRILLDYNSIKASAVRWLKSNSVFFTSNKVTGYFISEDKVEQINNFVQLIDSQIDELNSSLSEFYNSEDYLAVCKTLESLSDEPVEICPGKKLLAHPTLSLEKVMLDTSHPKYGKYFSNTMKDYLTSYFESLIRQYSHVNEETLKKRIVERFKLLNSFGIKDFVDDLEKELVERDYRTAFNNVLTRWFQ